jgi:hypothetical protein
MGEMSVAESVVIEAAIHRGAGRAHRMNAKAAHVTDAEAADMRSTNDANVSTSEAADVTAAKTATAARKSGTASRGYSNHRGCGDCENFAVNLNFHNLAPFSGVEPKLGRERWNFQYRLVLGMIDKIDLLLHQTVACAIVMRITSDSSSFSKREADREVC